MNNVLIVGGAGYIGSILTKKLLDEGFHVTVLDNFRFQQNSLLDCCSYENFAVIRGDCRDKDTVTKAIRGKDVIIPLAALVGAPLCDTDQTAALTTNLEAIRLLLSLRNSDQKIIFPSTASGYGAVQGNMLCTEETPISPISLYARTKIEAEKIIMQAGNAIIFRLTTVFGASPRMRIDLLVNDFVYRAVHDRSVILFEGDFKRDFIHVRDIARVFLHGIKNFDGMKNQIYNVGLNEANLSKKELCERIQKHIPEFTYVESKIGKDPDKRNYIVSTEKLDKTGFVPKYSLDFGIRELIKTFTILGDKKYSNV
ncbi:MAG TPA: NAD(P)-dependent oxidoreductase [Candidatus Acidoferrales bacterium]|nr:NAD(P)-dependent oxidoreductase [Candidatus Acidoferrales bacterium]